MALRNAADDDRRQHEQREVREGRLDEPEEAVDHEPERGAAAPRARRPHAGL